MNAPYQHQYRRWVWALMGAMTLVTCLKVWIAPGSTLPQAQAQLPDSAKQRLMLLEEARMTNQLLGEIKHILKTRTFNVRLDSADKKAVPPTRRKWGS